MERVSNIRQQWIAAACASLVGGLCCGALWAYLWLYEESWAQAFAVVFVFVLALALGSLVSAVALACTPGARPLCGALGVEEEEVVDEEKRSLLADP